VNCRGQNPDWFRLADDCLLALHALAENGKAAARTNLSAAPAVAALILIRSRGNLEGAILMAKRGMTAEARTLTRALVEAGFVIAALQAAPQGLVEILKSDSEKSLLQQSKLFLEHNPASDAGVLAAIHALVDRAGKPNSLDVRRVAEMGPLNRRYLDYRRLSDDSVHVTARSLHRHVRRQGASWGYAPDEPSEEDTEATLHSRGNAAVAVGIGGSDFLKDASANSTLAAIADRLLAMPPAP